MKQLFVPAIEVEQLHPNFSSVLVPSRKEERKLFEQWASGFIDRDGKFLKEFQTSFNSGFWEIYLHALFKHLSLEADYSYPSPDFLINTRYGEFIVEATTANAAQNKRNEWDRSFDQEELETLKDLNRLNFEAIIRLSNALIQKCRAFEKNYKNLKHVPGKPFVVAIAPFEQPHFNIQYDRPIKALLYDHYVEEQLSLDHPEAFDGRAPVVNLGYIEKDNGAEIPLGVFNDDSMSEISALIFSCTATWGKLSAMGSNSETIVTSIWSSDDYGKPEKRESASDKHVEKLQDGVQVYHNPNAKHPLPVEIFNHDGIVQVYLDFETGEWVHEGVKDSLIFRKTMKYIDKKDLDNLK